jgi:hypothetical protein
MPSPEEHHYVAEHEGIWATACQGTAFYQNKGKKTNLPTVFRLDPRAMNRSFLPLTHFIDFQTMEY